MSNKSIRIIEKLLKWFKYYLIAFMVFVCYIFICNMLQRSVLNPTITKHEQVRREKLRDYEKNTNIQNEYEIFAVGVIYTENDKLETTAKQIRIDIDSVINIICEDKDKVMNYIDSIKEYDNEKYLLIKSLNDTPEGHIKQYDIINKDLIKLHNLKHK